MNRTLVTPAQTSSNPLVKTESARPAQHTASEMLEQAAVEHARPLPDGLRSKLGAQLGHDFGHVRVHAGQASAAAADFLGARAYTLGRDIHLGSDVRSMGSEARHHLLTHEAIHTVQQGMHSIRPDIALGVSSPNDAAEREAHALADHLEHVPSQSLALRDQMFVQARPSIQRVVKPHLQRDLKGKHTVKDGTFDINLKTESHAGAKNGMSGTVKFSASGKAPDSNNIRLLQVIRDEDLSTGKDYVWTGGEAGRNKVMTSANKNKGVSPGFHVDHYPAAASPRTAKADMAVSPYYRDYWPNATSSQDGSKSGETVQEASLWDSPGSSGKRRFTFETAAKGTDTGYIFATLRWGFTISDPAKGTVTKEHAKAYRSPSATFGAAVGAFNEFYKNPGASTAPTN